MQESSHYCQMSNMAADEGSGKETEGSRAKPSALPSGSDDRMLAQQMLKVTGLADSGLKKISLGTTAVAEHKKFECKWVNLVTSLISYSFQYQY